MSALSLFRELPLTSAATQPPRLGVKRQQLAAKRLERRMTAHASRQQKQLRLQELRTQTLRRESALMLANTLRRYKQRKELERLAALARENKRRFYTNGNGTDVTRRWAQRLLKHKGKWVRISNPRGAAGRDVYIPDDNKEFKRLFDGTLKYILSDRTLEDSIALRERMLNKKVEDAISAMMKAGATTRGEAIAMALGMDKSEAHLVDEATLREIMSDIRGDGSSSGSSRRDSPSDGYIAMRVLTIDVLDEPPVDAVETKDWGQLLAEGAQNCVLKPIHQWAAQCEADAKSDRAKRRFKSIAKELVQYEVEAAVKGGCDKDILQRVADTCKVDITIEMPLLNHVALSVTPSVGRYLKVFKYLNTRWNHVDEGGVLVTSNVQRVDRDTLQSMYDRLKSREEFFVFTCDNTSVSSITMRDFKYVLQRQFSEDYNAFLESTGLDCCFLDAKDESVRELNEFVLESVKYNGTHQFDTSSMPLQAGEWLNIDMKNAYAAYKTCLFYSGFLGKITDFRPCNKYMGPGIYRIGRLWFEGKTKEQLHMNRLLVELDCYSFANVEHVLTSPELHFLERYGYRFDYKYGAWGSVLDFDMPTTEYDDGVKFHARFAGQANSLRHDTLYHMHGSPKLAAEMEKHKLNKQCKVMVLDKDAKSTRITCIYPAKTVKHLSHVTSFILAYQRLQVFEQLSHMRFGMLLRINTDGIYYRPYRQMITLEPFRDATAKSNYRPELVAMATYVPRRCDDRVVDNVLRPCEDVDKAVRYNNPLIAMDKYIKVASTSARKPDPYTETTIVDADVKQQIGWTRVLVTDYEDGTRRILKKKLAHGKGGYIWLVTKTCWKLGTTVPSTDAVQHPSREHHPVELWLGAGGTGKTFENMHDDGLVKKLYVAHSYKLARSKEREAIQEVYATDVLEVPDDIIEYCGGVSATVHAQLLSANLQRRRAIAKKYNVLVVDECSVLTQKQADEIVSWYGSLGCKVIFIGDVGYQAPPFTSDAVEIDVAKVQEQGWHVVRREVNRRVKCDELMKMLNMLRCMISDKVEASEVRDYVMRTCQQHVTDVQLGNMYDHVKDIILTRDHGVGQVYNNMFADRQKYLITANYRTRSNGDVVFEKPAGMKHEMRHFFTVHQVQGETFDGKMFVYMDLTMEPRVLYTALSRCRRMEQIHLLVNDADVVQATRVVRDMHFTKKAKFTDAAFMLIEPVDADELDALIQGTACVALRDHEGWSEHKFNKQWATEVDMLKQFKKQLVGDGALVSLTKRDCGRMYSKKGTTSLANMRREVRTVLTKQMYDFDLSNAQPTIMLSLCEKHKLHAPNLTRYCTKRKEILQHYMRELNLTRDYVKRVFLRLMFLGNVDDTVKGDAFLEALHDELIDLARALADLYPEILAKTNMAKKSTNKLATFLSYLLGNEECRVVCTAMQLLREHTCLFKPGYDGLSRGSYEYDGFRVLQSEVEEYGGVRKVVDKLNLISSALGYKMLKWEIK